MTIHPAALLLAPLTLAFAISTSGCARQQILARPGSNVITAATLPPPPPPPPPPASPPAPPPALVIAPEIKSQCNLREVESVAEAPKFAFDSSLIGTEEIGLIQQLATCFTTGPMKGRTLTLIGRADPRGPRKYNQTLGEKRANAVQGALVGFGLPLASVTSTSRGAKDATGQDEEGWQIDRRVDVGVDVLK